MLLIRNLTRTRIDRNWFGKVARKTLKVVGIKGRTEISLVICGTKKICQLNRIYRSKDKVTDVLSFGREFSIKSQKLKTKGQKRRFVEPPNKIAHLGEIFICLPQAKKQAKIYNKPLKHALAGLLIHGILHLAGYNHQGKSNKMMKIQEEILTLIRRR